ncbi:MAG: U32 family peptidase [Clostridiales bacterium]|nr:U32 family peptidase [Clostridiales bacterium]
MKKLEILAPGGSEQAIKAAVAGGADAVYFGGAKFNARQNAENVSDDSLKEIIDFCHVRGVKVYITVNTIYTEKELPNVLEFCEEIRESGADALIVADLGAAKIFRDNFSDIPLFASTQLTVHSKEDALFLRDAGFSRVIVSRELNIEQIREISSVKGIQTEVFVHGALCVCYSGRCLMSSMIGARSGNRGVCAQPCRKIYTLREGEKPLRRGYLLSTKDLRGIEFVRELAESGVTSLKIEGRMKNPEYVYQTAKTYSMAANGEFDESEIKKLFSLFNRGGFTDGYFKKHSDSSMVNTKSPKNAGVVIGEVTKFDYVTRRCEILLSQSVEAGDGIEIRTKAKSCGMFVNVSLPAGETLIVRIGDDDVQVTAGNVVSKTFDKSLTDEINSQIESKPTKIKVTGICRASAGLPITLRLKYNDIEVTVAGDVVQQAKSSPLAGARIAAALAKTGGTPFDASFDVEVDGDIFIPVAEVNSLRREAFATLEDEIKRSYDRPYMQVSYEQAQALPAVKRKKFTVSVLTKEQFDTAVNFAEQTGELRRIYIELSVFEKIAEQFEVFLKKLNAKACELFIALPHISKDNSFIEKLKKCGANGFLARTLGQLFALKDCGKTVCADYTFNFTSTQSVAAVDEYANIKTLSPELSLTSLAVFDENTEIIVYGHLPIMTTQMCPVGIYAAKKGDGKHCALCGKSGGFSLKDEIGAAFPIVTDCENCIAFVLNSRPLFIANKAHDIINTPIGSVRLAFYNETAAETAEVMTVYLEALKQKSSASLKYAQKLAETTGLTYGHFYRGLQ